MSSKRSMTVLNFFRARCTTFRVRTRTPCASLTLVAIAGVAIGCSDGSSSTGFQGADSGASSSAAGGMGSSGSTHSGGTGTLSGSSTGGSSSGSVSTSSSGASNGGGTGNSSGTGSSGTGLSGSSGGSSGGDGGVEGGGQVVADSGGDPFETDGSFPKNTWVQAFNHTDLTHLHPLIHGWKYDDNHYDTFRVDPITGYLLNSLAGYPGGAKGYGGHCGLLYVDRYFTDYRFRIEYHFTPNGDGNNNGGVEVFCQDPSQVTGDPLYAPGLEIQVIAQCTNGCGGGTTKAGDGSNNLSICQPTAVRASNIMGNPMAGTSNCTPGSYAKLPPQAQWVTIECEIRAGGTSKCWDCWENDPTAGTPFPGCTPDTNMQPAIAFSGVHDNRGMLKGGYFAAVQSEGQEQAYRSIEIMDLSP
jgi:hypothetical protein